MHLLPPRPQHPRRGVTLVEMLVVVALLVLMMTIIVQIFSAATGAVSAAKVYQELDDELRELDATLRQDLQGVTARFNPPLDPDQNLGDFEYIENSWADTQGEDTDDCLRFTAQSPPNQPFTGRMYIYTPAVIGGKNANALNYYYAAQPITITSEYAEIIYFLRNGNLYRRVLLIAPERQAAVNLAVNAATTPPTPLANFNTFLIPGGASVSWLGVNDLSARPSPRGPSAPPILNTLGDLTNRENRAFSPRFSDDYSGMNGIGVPDGIPDDYNNGPGPQGYAGDGVPDYYPTLYPGVFNLGLINTTGLQYPVTGINSPQFFAFPYVFPGAYSQPDPNALGTNLGWIHSLDPSLNTYNHAPLDVGDSLAPPDVAHKGTPQTWWGFPTWRETMSANWLDPVWQVHTNGVATKLGQTYGLQPNNSSSAPTAASLNLLPSATYWFSPQLFNDGAGSGSSFLGVYYNTTTSLPVQSIWEDDLIMTGVRSFDVKGYDDSVSSFVDLGNSPVNSNTITNNLVVGGTNWTTGGFPSLPVALNVVSTSLGHEGVMPPRSGDFRLDPQSQAKGIFTFIGDDNKLYPRMRRTYDTWSTEYTEAPANGYDPNTLVPYGLNVYPPNSLPLGDGIAPSNPVYPSYPPPYPVPLRGLQIQVRVVDPRNERVKVLTIRQDFSDKLRSNP